MTSARAMLTIQPAVGRENVASGTPAADARRRPDTSAPRSSGTSGARVAPERGPVGGPDSCLAPALRAAAAARAQTARIRAGQPQPIARSLADRRVLTPAVPPADPGPQSRGPGAESAAATAGSPGARGLSVAAAARASTVAFRPLRRASAPLLRDADPISARAANQAAAPLSVDRIPRSAPRRAEPPRRFAKTLAELERHQAATERDEPGAHIVPSPVLARHDQDETTGARWLRLWPRRRGPATE